MTDSSEPTLSRERAALLHRRVVTNYLLGNRYRWVACLAASRIVGRYDPGATLAMASDMGISISQVENYAAAGRFYRKFRRYMPQVGIDAAARRRLSPTHLTVAYHILTKYEPNPRDVLVELKTVADNGVSVEDMRDKMEGLFGPGKKGDKDTASERFTKHMTGAAEHLNAAVDCAPDQDTTRAVTEIRDAVRGMIA